MAYNSDQTVSENTMFLAKERGYDLVRNRTMAPIIERTYPDGSTQLFCEGLSKKQGDYIVPTQTEIHKFLREKHGIFVSMDRDEEFWVTKIFTLVGGNRYVKLVPARFLMYEAALEQGLFEGLRQIKI